MNGGHIATQTVTMDNDHMTTTTRDNEATQEDDNQPVNNWHDTQPYHWHTTMMKHMTMQQPTTTWQCNDDTTTIQPSTPPPHDDHMTTTPPCTTGTTTRQGHNNKGMTWPITTHRCINSTTMMTHQHHDNMMWCYDHVMMLPQQQHDATIRWDDDCIVSYFVEVINIILSICLKYWLFHLSSIWNPWTTIQYGFYWIVQNPYWTVVHGFHMEHGGECKVHTTMTDKCWLTTTWTTNVEHPAAPPTNDKECPAPLHACMSATTIHQHPPWTTRRAHHHHWQMAMSATSIHQHPPQTAMRNHPWTAPPPSTNNNEGPRPWPQPPTNGDEHHHCPTAPTTNSTTTINQQQGGPTTTTNERWQVPTCFCPPAFPLMYIIII